jgi:hypothetical protein
MLHIAAIIKNIIIWWSPFSHAIGSGNIQTIMCSIPSPQPNDKMAEGGGSWEMQGRSRDTLHNRHRSFALFAYNLINQAARRHVVSRYT